MTADLGFTQFVFDTVRASSAGSLFKVAVAGAKNVRSMLPGERPEWVVIDLTGSVVPRVERARLMGLPLPTPEGGGGISLEDLAVSLDALAEAPWLRGALFRFDGFSADTAVAFALRRAIQRLGAAGKETAAYVTQLDATTYYVASGAREIIAPESAEVSMRGFGVSITFLGAGLAKLGVRFEKVAIAEYKNAFDNLVREEISPAHREQLEVLLERILAHHASAIGEARGLAPAAVAGLLEEGISSAARALEAKLIDRVAYEDAIIGPKHAPLAEAKRFLGARVPPLRSGRVAVVWITGGIVSGRSRRMPGIFSSVTGSETAIRALRAAASDESTRAVVLAVDSPGGSALASDLIDREVQLLRAKKPVVAVMGAVAASGGYYVAAHANRIVAAPTTLTGSIGVLTGKIALEALFDRLGFRTARIQRGRFSLLLDPTKALDDAERALLERSNAEVYDRFVARVADGRRLSVDRVRELAKGRVWAGADAAANGLVDEIGDLETGLARARELAHLGVDAPHWTVDAPRETLLPVSSAEEALGFLTQTALREQAWAVAPMWLG